VVHSGRFFQFSFAGFNASNALDDLDYLLIFLLAQVWVIGGRGHPRPLPESATDEHTNDELSAVGLLSRSL